MSSFLDGLRGKRASTGFDRHALWQRSRALLASVWRPLQRRDATLPNWIHVLVGVSDDGLRIPGTSVRLGLDALLGALLPGAGDALGGVTSALLMYVAWRRGAPRDLLFRMLGNATADIGLGSIPIVGDLFDLGFHANRRNLSLLEEFLERRTRAERVSRLSAMLIFGLLGIVMLAVLAGVVGLLAWSWRKLEL
jgi:hypothetical protein